MVSIILRSQWGARPPLGVVRMPVLPSPKVYVHHTAGNERGAAGMRSIQYMHMLPVAEGGRGWRDIAYNFVIDGDDGKIYEGRGVGVRGGHVHGDENNNHGICVMGNFEREPFLPVAEHSLVELLRLGIERRWWAPWIVGHRDGPDESTACPGKNLYARLPAISKAVAAPKPPPAPAPSPPPPEDPDMRIIDCEGKPALVVFGDRSHEQINTEQRAALRSAGVPAGLVTQGERQVILDLLAV